MNYKNISKKQLESPTAKQAIELKRDEDPTQKAASALSNFDKHHMTPDTILSLQSTIGNASLASDSISTDQTASQTTVQRMPSMIKQFKRNMVRLEETGETVGGNPLHEVRKSDNDLFERKDKVVEWSIKKNIVAVFDRKGKQKFALNNKTFSKDAKLSHKLKRMKKLIKFKAKVEH